MSSQPQILLAALVVCLSLGSTAPAQVAPKPATVPVENPNGEEVVQLTPFQVNAGDNKGRAPSETLAGCSPAPGHQSMKTDYLAIRS